MGSAAAAARRAPLRAWRRRVADAERARRALRVAEVVAGGVRRRRLWRAVRALAHLADAAARLRRRYVVVDARRRRAALRDALPLWRRCAAARRRAVTMLLLVQLAVAVAAVRRWADAARRRGCEQVGAYVGYRRRCAAVFDRWAVVARARCVARVGAYKGYRLRCAAALKAWKAVPRTRGVRGGPAEGLRWASPRTPRSAPTHAWAAAAPWTGALPPWSAAQAADLRAQQQRYDLD